MWVCVGMGVQWHACISGDDLWELVLSFYHVDPKDGTWVLRLGKQVPWPAELSLVQHIHTYICFFNVYSKIFHKEENQGILFNHPHLLLKSTWMEWSITRSAGQTGFIFSGFPPNFFTASRIAAKSTTAGTPLGIERSKQETAINACDWILQVCQC